ncbi:hypothetical protein ZIOFF_017033 [Zingiber officinale]|nr:hypothetical protein ZIOFF_017033 [Zingiber officinale]
MQFAIAGDGAGERSLGRPGLRNRHCNGPCGRLFLLRLLPAQRREGCSIKVNDPIVRPLHELDSKALHSLIPEILYWMKNPNCERVDWLYKFILDMWPCLHKAICNTIQSAVRPIFDQYTGKYWIKSIEFDHLTLGSLPPTIHGVKVYETQEKELVVQLAVRWAGNTNVALVINAAVKKPVRILNVNVVCAYDLLKMDILGKSDPYVKLSLSGEGLPSKKTSIKMRNLNPEWNEQFKLIVKDPETLDVLFPHETKEFTVDLLKNMNPNDPQNKRNRGKIVLHLTFDPFKEDTGTFSKVLEEKLSSIDSGIQDASGNGGLLLVIVEAAEDVEGKHHTNPYAVVIRRSRDPRWNEDFQFMLEEAPKGEKLHVEGRRRGQPEEKAKMIEVVLNDRLGKKVRVKCNEDDTIGDLKKLVAAQTGTRADKIRIQKWYNIYKDHITLKDYEIHDGMGLELYYN